MSLRNTSVINLIINQTETGYKKEENLKAFQNLTFFTYLWSTGPTSSQVTPFTCKTVIIKTCNRKNVSTCLLMIEFMRKWRFNFLCIRKYIRLMKDLLPWKIVSLSTITWVPNWETLYGHYNLSDTRLQVFEFFSSLPTLDEHSHTVSTRSLKLQTAETF
jgi:hypothetical protein